MKAWVRALGYAAAVLLVGFAYFLGFGNRGDNGADSSALMAPDPGYAARDAEVIETGYDGRERYRLNASVIRQQSDGGVIDLEQLEMDYHPGAQSDVPGERPATPASASAARVPGWSASRTGRSVRATSDRSWAHAARAAGSRFSARWTVAKR